MDSNEHNKLCPEAIQLMKNLVNGFSSDYENDEEGILEEGSASQDAVNEAAGEREAA